MIRRPSTVIVLGIAILISLLLIKPARQMTGMIKVASDSGNDWYFVKDGLKPSLHDGKFYLDAVVVTYYLNEDGSSYIEKNNWHLDEGGNRYKTAFTSSYDCEGFQLGT